MRKFEHPDVQKPKTSKSTKKQDVVRLVVTVDLLLLSLLRSFRTISFRWSVDRTDILLQKTKYGLQTVGQSRQRP